MDFKTRSSTDKFSMVKGLERIISWIDLRSDSKILALSLYIYYTYKYVIHGHMCKHFEHNQWNDSV